MIRGIRTTSVQVVASWGRVTSKISLVLVHFGLRPGLIEGECVENILHNGRCCADIMAQMRRSVLTIPLGSPRSPFSISPNADVIIIILMTTGSQLMTETIL